MLLHIQEHTGILHSTYGRYPVRLTRNVRWRDLPVRTWSSEMPYRHGKAPKARMAL